MRNDDSGLTLVELIVYSLLLVSVLLIVGTIMISTLNLERIVRETTLTASEAQIATTTIESGVRNASHVDLTTIGDDQLLRVRTVGSTPGSAQWSCRGWYYSDSTNTLRSTRTANDSIEIAAPTGEPTGWTLLATGVTPAALAGIFGLDAATNSVTIDFQGITEDSSPIAIHTSVTPRVVSAEETTCF